MQKQDQKEILLKTNIHEIDTKKKMKTRIEVKKPKEKN